MAEPELALKYSAAAATSTASSDSSFTPQAVPVRHPQPQPQSGAYIGPEASINGETTFSGSLKVEGRLGGRINSDSGTVIVGRTGQVTADINVAVAIIEGRVIGN